MLETECMEFDIRMCSSLTNIRFFIMRSIFDYQFMGLISSQFQGMHMLELF
jgi:hypothetical protein